MDQPLLYISLPSLQEYDVKPPNFTFCGGRELKRMSIVFSPWASIQSFRTYLQKNSPTFVKLNEKRDWVWSSANSLLKWRFCSRRCHCCLSSLKTFLGDLESCTEITPKSPFLCVNLYGMVFVSAQKLTGMERSLIIKSNFVALGSTQK